MFLNYILYKVYFTIFGVTKTHHILYALTKFATKIYNLNILRAKLYQKKCVAHQYFVFLTLINRRNAKYGVHLHHNKEHKQQQPA